MLPAEFIVMRWFKALGVESQLRPQVLSLAGYRLCWGVLIRPILPSEVLHAAFSKFATQSCAHHLVSISGCLLPCPAGLLFPWSVLVNIFLSLNNLVKMTRLKHRLSGPQLRFWLSRCGWGLRMCLPDKFQASANASGLGTTLWESLLDLGSLILIILPWIPIV